MKFSYAMLALFLGFRSQLRTTENKKHGRRLHWWTVMWFDWLLVIGCLVVYYCWLLVIGCSLFVVHCWLLVGYWLVVIFSTSEVPCDQRMAGGLVRGEGVGLAGSRNQRSEVGWSSPLYLYQRRSRFHHTKKNHKELPGRRPLWIKGDVSDVWFRMLMWWKVNCWA